MELTKKSEVSEFFILVLNRFPLSHLELLYFYTKLNIITESIITENFIMLISIFPGMTMEWERW